MPAIQEMTAIRWKALIQRYQFIAFEPSSHALEHLLDMRDRRCRHYAVAEIENKRSAGKRVQHVVDFAVERRAAFQ